METQSTTRILEIHKADDGVLVTFEDGKSALYSPALLYAMYSQAKAMPEFEDEN
jgi:hypothetical protein